MTDAEVTHRVEQAMLGAMMGRPRSADQLGVRPGDFADERHQAIAAALTGQAGSERGLFGRLIGFFTRRGRAAREAAEYMDSLPGLCPDPGHIAAYFQMLAADRDQRARAQQAAVQAQGNQVLDVAADRLGQMRGRTDASTGMPQRTARLARALVQPEGRRGQAPAPVATQGPGGRPQPAQEQVPVQPGTAPQPERAQGQTRDTADVPVQAAGPAAEFVRGTSGHQVPGGSAGRGFEPGQFARMEDLEDAILVGLMRHPDEARDVTRWLSPEAFTGPRRELFTMIGQYTRERRDIDPVTLAWGAAQANEVQPGGAPIAEHEGWLRPEFVLRLGAMSTAQGMASVLGRSLLAERLYTQQHGPEWFRPRKPQTAPPAQAQPRQQAQDQGRTQEVSRQSQQSRERSPQREQEPQGQRARNDQRPPEDHQQEEERLRLYERAMAANRASAPESPERVRAPQEQGPYRQSRPGNGNRPPTPNGPGNPPARVVPDGGLLQEPPSAPDQNGMSQQR